MNDINIVLIKKLLSIPTPIEDIIAFLEEFQEKKEYIHNINWLMETKNIPKKMKNIEEIKAFINKHRELIKTLNENEVLYDITFSWSFKHYYPVYKDILKDIQSTGKEKVFQVINKLEEKGFKSFIFAPLQMETIYYDKIKKSYGKETYEIEYHFSNGKKYFLGNIFPNEDAFPLFFKDATIILVYYKNTYSFWKNTVYFSTFNVDLDEINFDLEDEDIILQEEIEKTRQFSKMCRFILSIDKIIDSLRDSIKEIEELLKYEEICDIYERELCITKKRLEEYKKQKENVIHKYVALGYNEDIINKSLKHMKKQEYENSLDID